MGRKPPEKKTIVRRQIERVPANTIVFKTNFKTANIELLVIKTPGNVRQVDRLRKGLIAAGYSVTQLKGDANMDIATPDQKKIVILSLPASTNC